MFNFVGRDRKLQEERLRQEKLIAEQLKEMNMDHELEYEKLTQRGLVANKEQTMAKEKELELLEKKRLARKGSKTSFQGSEDDTESSAEESKPRGAINREEMSYIDMARTGYQQLVNLIIRPPRADYEVCYVYVRCSRCLWNHRLTHIFFCIHSFSHHSLAHQSLHLQDKNSNESTGPS